MLSDFIKLNNYFQNICEMLYLVKNYFSYNSSQDFKFKADSNILS